MDENCLGSQKLEENGLEPQELEDVHFTSPLSITPPFLWDGLGPQGLEHRVPGGIRGKQFRVPRIGGKLFRAPQELEEMA